MYVATSLNATIATDVAWGYVSRLGNAMLDTFKVEIGGSKIDEQWGDWLNIWYELTHKVGQERGFARMIGDVSELKNVTKSAKRAYKLYTPLIFWFNRNNGLALPLIALQYHDVRITLKFRDALSCVNYVNGGNVPSITALGNPSMGDSYLLIDYVYLDSEERKRFAQASHEYLIEQLQFTGSESLNSTNNKYRLNFNHPSKYVVFVAHLERYLSRNNWVSYSTSGDWSVARDVAAKHIWAAARLTDTNVITWSTGAIGDVREPSIQSTGCPLNTLQSKIEAKIVQTVVATNPQTVGLDDIILVRNDLTMEDLSNTIEQLTVGGATIVSANAWLVANCVSAVNYFNYGNFVDGSDNPVYNAKLQLNGHDRFQQRDGNYFNYVQPYQHFDNTPSDGVNLYSFALKAADHQPTGTCNFSRIDNATLQVDVGMYNAPALGTSNYATNYVGTASSNSIINIYTMNYNVLRVMSLRSWLPYSFIMNNCNLVNTFALKSNTLV